MQIVTQILGRYKANENGGLDRREGESGLVFATDPSASEETLNKK